ncbi:hypothetical protein C8R43DRAFT_831764, partial [Mycena crocata]
LESFSSKTFTRVDNVFCSPGLVGRYICCDVRTSRLRTDHFPIIHEIDLDVVEIAHVPKPMWRKTEWDEFRVDLMLELIHRFEPRDSYDTPEELDTAIAALDAAIQAVVERKVPMSKPSPYTKRWFTKELKARKQESEKASREAFRWRYAPEHPAHEKAR